MSRKFSLIVLAALGLFCITTVALGAIQGPQEVNYEGKIGPVTRLADGRLFTALIESSRGVKNWSDTSVLQRVLGRFSSDDGLHWTSPQLLLESNRPGIWNAPLSMGTRDGSIHLFIRDELNLDHPLDWTKATTNLWHSVSRDGGKTWEPPRKIDFGGQWIGTIMVAIQLKSGRILLPFCYSDFAKGRAIGLFVSSSFYSDDGGNAWRRSTSKVAVDSGGKLVESGSIEPVVTQLV